MTKAKMIRGMRLMSMATAVSLRVALSAQPKSVMASPATPTMDTENIDPNTL